VLLVEPETGRRLVFMPPACRSTGRYLLAQVFGGI
jgi:hypothetical protein